MQEAQKPTLDKWLLKYGPYHKYMQDRKLCRVDMSDLPRDVKVELWGLSDFVVSTVACDQAYLVVRKEGSESCPVVV